MYHLTITSIDMTMLQMGTQLVLFWIFIAFFHPFRSEVQFDFTIRSRLQFICSAFHCKYIYFELKSSRMQFVLLILIKSTTVNEKSQTTFSLPLKHKPKGQSFKFKLKPMMIFHCMDKSTIFFFEFKKIISI